jgi:hypothetical protein
MAEGPAEPYGYVKISRKAYENCAFWNEPREFSRWEAWEDLIATAAWKAHTRLVDVTVVHLQRGQILASERFLAERWSWSRGKVRRFLSLLVDMQRITVNPAHEAAHVGAILTLCNYNRYQTTLTSDRPTNGPEADQDEPKEKAVKKGKTTTNPKRASAMPDDWSPNATHQQIATAEGRTLDREAERFRDYANAKGATYKDWDAAFRNWLRSDYGRKDASNGKTGSGNTRGGARPRTWTYENATTEWKGFNEDPRNTG